MEEAEIEKALNQSKVLNDHTQSEEQNPVVNNEKSSTETKNEENDNKI